MMNKYLFGMKRSVDCGSPGAKAYEQKQRVICEFGECSTTKIYQFDHSARENKPTQSNLGISYATINSR